MAKRLRVCPDCPQLTFENGNQLKKHRRSFHPATQLEAAKKRRKLAAFRREILLPKLRGTT